MLYRDKTAIQRAVNSWDIRVSALPALLDLRSIQHQLLESPADLELWQALNRAVTSPKPATPEQPPVQATPLAQSPAPKPRLRDSAAHTSSIRPGTPRPILRRFHSEGSPEVEALRRAQLAELQSLAAANHHDSVLERLGHDLVEPLAAQLPTATAYDLGHAAYEQELRWQRPCCRRFWPQESKRAICSLGLSCFLV